MYAELQHSSYYLARTKQVAYCLFDSMCFTCVCMWLAVAALLQLSVAALLQLGCRVCFTFVLSY